LNFFDDLELDIDNPTIQKVSFGRLMNSINMSNRWVYKGSLTRPPCERFVYWNVIDRVYPIR
jgi:carbonic anhydrase